MAAAVPESVWQKIISGIPIGRLGRADEVAAAVRYLVSDQAAFRAGSVTTVNGAQYIANG